MITILATEKEFLKESNAIEGVYDDDSLEQAILAWEYLKTKDKLTHQVVCKTHKILMLNHDLYPNEKGYYRRRPVYIAGHEAMRPGQIEDAMGGWLYKVNSNVARYSKDFVAHAFDNRGGQMTRGEFAKSHHIEYEKIHPFIDGNGRTGRMFMNWERIKVGLDILVIHEGEEQMAYYQWFK